MQPLTYKTSLIVLASKGRVRHIVVLRFIGVLVEVSMRFNTTKRSVKK